MVLRLLFKYRDYFTGEMTMKKVNIKHIPEKLKKVMTAMAVAVLILGLAASTTVIFYVLAFLLLIIVVIIFNVKTTVEFGEGSVIKCKWLFVNWNIDIEKIGGAAYSLKRHRRKAGASYFFELRFYREGKNAPEKLNETLSIFDANNCIQGNYDKVQLMQVYRYIEEYYPYKARGYEK